MRIKFTFSVDRTVSVKLPRGMTIKQFLQSDEFNDIAERASDEIRKEVEDEVESGYVADLVFFNATPMQWKARK